MPSTPSPSAAQHRKMIASVCLLGWLAAGWGCRSSPENTPHSVAGAWSQASRSEEASLVAHPQEVPVGRDESSASRALATVDGRSIAEARVVDLLLRSHGPGILEQIAVLERATHLAAARGLHVTEADVEDEYERALRRLSDPLAGQSTGKLDRAKAEGVLNAVLAERNISREEFMMGMERNAYLRKLVLADLVVGQAELKAEFARYCGERVRVRHLQLANLREVAAVRERLDAGADFAEVVRELSANIVSGPNGGLLEPFSREDEQVPAVLRQAAFDLDAGAVSEPIRVGGWIHMLQLLERIPPSQSSFEEVERDLEKRLRERLAEPAMQELHEKLLKEADIRVFHPALREAFLRRHPERQRR